MFTRAIEITCKSGKSRDLSTTINQKVVPLLRAQPGFVDEIVLISSSDPNRVLALSFWKTQQDAERYAQEHYPKVNDMIRHLIEGNPTLRTYQVDASTTHRIAAGQAA